MTQVSLSTSTTFDGDLNALVEDLGTALTVRFDLDEPAPAGGLKVYIDSDVEQIFNRLDLPGAIANPQTENLNLLATQTNFDNSGLAVEIAPGATFATVTLSVFDNPEPDTFLPETFDGRVDAVFSLLTADQIAPEDQSSITGVSDYTIDPTAASSTVIFVDEASQLMDTEPPTEPPMTDGLQVSLFTGPGYLIEDEGTVSAHAFLATGGVIPEEGLVVSVDAPNLSEFDLAGVSVEGGEIVAVRDGGFDLRMTEYTTLVNLPIADDGETETGEIASFSLAAGDGYEIVADYSGDSFNLVDTRSDIPRGEVGEADDTISLATDTQISPENPTFSSSGSVYFDIGNRYLNEDGTYTYIDATEDVDFYKVELTAGETIAIETFEIEGNPDPFGNGLEPGLMVFDATGNQAIDYAITDFTTAPFKLFGGSLDPFDENRTNTYTEFTAPEDGTYYVAFGGWGNVWNYPGVVSDGIGIYDPFVEGSSSSYGVGNYDIEIDLLTEDNPRKTATPTPPVSNPGVSEPPTLALSANPVTTDSEGNFTNAVVEHIELGGLSSTTFTIRADGDIPEGGIEFVLNSDANLFEYTSILQQFVLPTTIGGQSLGAFYNQDGIPTGIRLRIDEPTMTVTLQTAFNQTWYTDFIGNVIDEFEPLETDGLEDVTFFLQPGEGYEVAADAGSTEVTYYDSLADVPASTVGGDTVPQVGVSISETELIETEGTETTITFTLSEPPPEDGVVVYLDSSQDPLVGSVLSQFNVLEAEITGGNFPVPNGDSSGFFFTITEQTASITVSVFDELTVPDINPFAVQEGILGVNFALQPQAGYTIDPDASEISLTIADNPDSKNQVVLSGEPETLVESEGTVGVHTFTVSNDLPSEGITVSVSTPDLSEFDLDAIEVNGGSIAEVRSDGFDFTITEQIATIGLPVLDDGISEGSETATFTLEPGDSYETNVDGADIATFILADSVDEVSVPEEIEGNGTLAEANALGLSVDNPVTFLNGFIAGDFFYDPSEDVDFYTFDLEAGQTVSLDIDSSEWNTLEVFEYPVIFPALNEVQTPDTELRLFDAQGNELAANNDGAAPGEDFSRDPYLEFTAETAGTYYVGVSALGNRNYDPYIDRSGSGWTFPEVGVFYGPYELTATLTESTIEFDIVGTEDAETLVGDAEDNNIEGLGGDDTIAGGLANDLILGGDGDDVLRGDRNSRSTQDGEPGGDDIIFGGEGNDRIGGKAGNDILSGDAGDDFIWGDDGDDILMGVTGNDILTGDNSSSGSGSDTFVFGNGDGTDTITDFEVGLDFIGLVEGELVFEDLSFTQDGDNTLLGVSDSGETLAILNNVQASLLDASSFVIVPDVSNPQEALALI